MRKSIIRLTLAIIASQFWAWAVANAGRPQISGGIDARFIGSNDDQGEAKVEGIFLNLRKVFSDNKADRIIAVAQMDWDDNFHSLRPYQTYVHYKGPLGRWNLLVGHFILPFGLLQDFDSERLLIQTEEFRNLGIKLDTGAKASGHLGDFNYSLSVSQGIGRYRIHDNDENKLIVGRIGLDQKNWTGGVSILNGRVFTKIDGAPLSDYRNLSALDATGFFGPTTVRVEAAAGKSGGKNEKAAYLGIDHAVSTRLELNLKYAYWKENLTWQDWGIGLSYNIWRRFITRAAYQYQHSQEDDHEVSIQIYWDFGKTL